MPMVADQNHPPVWSTYLATDDADATSAAVEAAGGSILSPAMDVGEFGRMAIAQSARRRRVRLLAGPLAHRLPGRERARR